MGQESIDVYYKPIGGGFYYKYLVYTDSNGNQTAARGGPEGGFSGSADSSGTDSGDTSNSPSNNTDVYGHGNIKTEVGSFTESDNNGEGGFSDHPGDGPPHPSENIATGDDLSSAWDSIEQSMTDIENGGYDYDPVPGIQDGHNSNSTIDTALDRAGLPQPTQDGPGDNWSPGSEKIIPPVDPSQDNHHQPSSMRPDGERGYTPAGNSAPRTRPGKSRGCLLSSPQATLQHRRRSGQIREQSRYAERVNDFETVAFGL